MWKILEILTNLTGPTLVWYIYVCKLVHKFQKIAGIQMNDFGARVLVEAGLARMRIERQCEDVIEDAKILLSEVVDPDTIAEENELLYKNIRLSILKRRKQYKESYKRLSEQWDLLIGLLFDIDDFGMEVYSKAAQAETDSEEIAELMDSKKEAANGEVSDESDDFGEIEVSLGKDFDNLIEESNLM